MLRRCCLAALAALLPACNGRDTPTSPAPNPAEAVFVVRACATATSAGERFQVLTRDPQVIAQATALIGAGPRKIVTARLVAGDGGFNAPWHWHLSPEDVAIVDTTIELCDGCPHDVEADLGYWIGTVGRYCPWSSEILARER